VKLDAHGLKVLKFWGGVAVIGFVAVGINPGDKVPAQSAVSGGGRQSPVNQDRCPRNRSSSFSPASSDWRSRSEGAEHCHLNFLGHPTGAECPPAKSRFVLAIGRGVLAEMSEKTSMACRDTQSQSSPNQALDYRAKLFLQGASQATASLGPARAR
jgi:hypothetical protein